MNEPMKKVKKKDIVPASPLPIAPPSCQPLWLFGSLVASFVRDGGGIDRWSEGRRDDGEERRRSPLQNGKKKNPPPSLLVRFLSRGWCIFRMQELQMLLCFIFLTVVSGGKRSIYFFSSSSPAHTPLTQTSLHPRSISLSLWGIFRAAVLPSPLCE